MNKMGLCFMIVIFIALTVTECHSVEIGVMSRSDLNDVVTLHYLNGNCSWKVIFNQRERIFETDEGSGPQIQVKGKDVTSFYQVKCVVDENVLLNATITAYDIVVPAPENVTLDTENRTIQWDHVFQPSDLQSDFKVVHSGVNINYLVHMYEKDGVDGGTSVEVPVDRLYLNLYDESIELTSCAEQEFVVQAVVNNDFHSQNSSAVNGIFFEVPDFRNLSAYLQLLIPENIFTIEVTFELTQEQCVGQTLSAFTITLHGLGSFIFDVNDTHIENGAANFTLPLNGSDPMLDVCTLGGVVFGSNEVGNSTAENIQLPDECLSVTPTSSHAAVATTTPMTAPPPTVASTTDTTDTTEPSQNDPTIAVIVAVAMVLIAIIVIAIGAVTIVIVVRKHRAVVPGPEVNEYQNIVQDDGAAVEEKSTLKKSHYVEVRPLTVPNEKPAVDMSTTIYATVDHKKTEELHQTCLQEVASAPKPERLKQEGISLDPKVVGLSRKLHLELLLAVLAPVKAKWYALGTHMNLSENFLDETETNIETDEECLSDIMKNWLGYHDPSMEVLNYALSQIDEQPIMFDGGLKEFVVVAEKEEEGRAVEGETSPDLPERSS